jgi:mono/diheme cytochrome c family protein
MPGFGDRLDQEQLRSVVTFTRVEFGGIDPADATSDCFE